MRIEVEPGDYKPLCTIRAFRGDKLIYRHLIRKTDEAKHRAEIARLFGD